MAVPSIKGSVFSTVVEDVSKLIEQRDLPDPEIDRWLQPADRKLLSVPISVSSWYDIRVYTRMNLMLRDLAADGDDAYLRERGRETARRLLESGLYAQLEFLHRTEVARTAGAQARTEAFGRDLRKLTTISSSILNFSRWTVEPDPDHEGRYLILVAEAEDFPEVLAWRSDGFVNEMARTHGSADLWTWSRPTSDRIVYRMQRDV